MLTDFFKDTLQERIGCTTYFGPNMFQIVLHLNLRIYKSLFKSMNQNEILGTLKIWSGPTDDIFHYCDVNYFFSVTNISS